MPRRIVRVISAGGVIVRRRGGRLDVCLICRDRHGPPAWGLPKGHVEAGETFVDAARREVREETGLIGRVVAPLAPIRYRFTLRPDPALYAKTVHYFLMRYERGSVHGHDREVLEARWMPIDDAIARAAYANERAVLREAKRMLHDDPHS